MRAPVAARQAAAAALATLPQSQRSAAELPTMIASGSTLAAADMEVLADFWARPGDGSESWVMASRLMGGPAMARAISAAADVGESLTFVPLEVELTEITIAASAAPAPGFPELSALLGGVQASLDSLDDLVIAEVGAIAQMAYLGGLGRIGRMATRASGNNRDLPPATAAMVASAEDLATITDPAKLILPGLEDAALMIGQVIERTRNRGVAIIADAFAVDIEPEWPELAPLIAEFTGRVSAEVLARAGSTNSDNLDPAVDTGDPLQLPFEPVRWLLAAAGGAASRDGAGRPVTADGTPGGDGVAGGANSTVMIRDAVAAWAPTAVTASARRRAGANISDVLRAELSEVASAVAPVEGPPRIAQVVDNVWTLDMNGTTKTTHFGPHEKRAGLVVTAEADLLVDDNLNVDEWPGGSHFRPGDHPRCHCGWRTRVRFVEVPA